VVRKQLVAENGEIVAAAITTEGEAEATVKNPAASQWPCVADAAKPRLRADPADEATIFGKVVAVLRVQV
jgi:SOS-response transcriptional repressor LexA